VLDLDETPESEAVFGYSQFMHVCADECAGDAP
jgi:hypothetical protein